MMALRLGVLIASVAGTQAFTTMTPQNVHARNPNKMMSLQPALVAKPHKKFQSTLAMSSISLEDFDKGGADPLASMEALNAVVPRKEITKLIKQSSDAEGIKQVCCASLQKETSR